MKKIGIILFAVLFGAMQSKAFDFKIEELKTGNRVTRNLEAGDNHWYKIYAQMNETLVFETTINYDTDPNMNITIELYYEEAGYMILAENDGSRQNDFNSSGNCWRIRLKTESGKTYYVKVQGKNNSIGTYQFKAHYTKEISVLDGTITLEMSESRGDFQCIGIQFSDKNINSGVGTYIEIKKRNGDYLIWGEKDSNMNKVIEKYLKNDLFKSFYNKKDKKRGKKVWIAFVKEGGLQSFIDFASEIADEEFLNSPFNEIYG